MDKIYNFLKSMSKNYLQNTNSNYLSDSNYNKRTRTRNVISENKAQSLKQNITRFLTEKKISFNEHQQIMTMIDEDNSALNTIVNLFRMNKDEHELIGNLKIMLIQFSNNNLH